MDKTAREQREYGAQGWLGIITPQANATVEAEMQQLLPRQVLPLFTRATSLAQDSLQRLVDYFEGLEHWIQSFDTLPWDAIGFACTGSSYLVGRESEARLIDQLESRTSRPIVTATQAIGQELKLLGVDRICIVAPYPEALCEAATAYWSEAGFEVTQLQRMDLGTADTRAIYDIRSADVLPVLQQTQTEGAQALLMSGTGMPTLTAMARIELGLPLLSSNLCLAGALLRCIGGWPEDSPILIDELLASAGSSVGAS